MICLRWYRLYANASWREKIESRITMTAHERNELLTLADSRLLLQCRVDCFRGSGRGGQKRNTTESAVRVTHEPTGIAAVSDKTRSQNANRRLALRQLRHEIALQCRSEPPQRHDGPWCPGARTAEYAVWMATVLDVLADCDWRVSEAANFFGVSTAALVRALQGDEKLWQRVNAARQKRGFRPLRAR